ncbi:MULTISPECIES: hypothetical protein [Ralstonia]|jgi:hypothetical protein|uniref:hypothetical protein n=1 Tax=Ralstonia TaxID=48736 RepID=UPI0015F8F4EB|nr:MULTISPECIES: hypothetical protein [Ralstonia]MBB0027147.1 hypothetical protein [Ralstonia pickettii]MBB0037686.1 hypothetical protein [Ralstonia pickettii]MBB0100208.1 hypothetical protein [Ralstonia pickettii]MBB0110206.1 hypothetical protein [Ralstonia pickettii]MBB0131270.1 hypothetical protein [Ralstonia pickettii]
MNTTQRSLAGKRVLIMSPSFFGYENAIAQAVRALGAHAEVVLDKPSNTVWTKAATRVSPSLVATRMTDYIRSLAEQHGRDSFDEIIVIKGEALHSEAVELLRASFPRARCTYYNWDSLRNYPHLTSILPLFDACFSFDVEDCESIEGLAHLPLFYTDEYRDLPLAEPRYDLFAVASLHSDRYEVIQRVIQQCPEATRAFTYFFYPSKIALVGKKVLEPSFVTPPLREIQWTPLPKDIMIDGLVRCRAVIDVQHPRQTGLTMRTIEMVGANKKLITTNPLVKTYDFYDPNNILVIDRTQPEIPPTFFDTDYTPQTEAIRQNYSIHTWLAVLLGLQPVAQYQRAPSDSPELRNPAAC